MDKTLKDEITDYLQDCDKFWYDPSKRVSEKLIRDMQQALEQQKEREGKLVVAIRKELDLAIEYRTRLDFLKERTPFQEGYITALRFTEATLKELGIL